MKHSLVAYLSGAVLAAIAVFQPMSSVAEGASQPKSNAARADEAANPDQPMPRVDDLQAQDQEVLGWANAFSRESEQLLESWLASNSMSEDKLFSRLYYPVANTDPVKFNTDYDSLADRDFPAVEERYLSKSTTVLYAIITDQNGYVPTHNRQFSQPLTGNRAVDLVNNRTKRIFGDVVGFNAARNQSPHVVQRYKRDTGEQVKDLSVPVRVRGKHWGCVRIGYRQIDNAR